MVEFALVLPLMVLIVYGSIEMGWAMLQRGIVQYAAHEGARVIATCKGMRPASTGEVVLATGGNDTCDAIGRVNEVLGMFFSAPNIDDANYRMDWADARDERFFKLILQRDYYPLIGYFGSSGTLITVYSTTFYEAETEFF